MRVSKWGNSLAVRLPAIVVDVLELKEGDELELRVREPGALEVARSTDRDALFKRLEKYRGRLPADFKFDREEANAR
jgi:antitoxin MazE